MVVAAGLNTGLAIKGLLTPVVGDQLNVVALLLVFAVTVLPGQIAVSAFTVRVRLLVELIVTGTVLTQPAALVTVAV